MAYPTLDYLTDLSLSQRSAARPLPFTVAAANTAGWENIVFEFRSDDSASFSDVYRMTFVQGASYSILSSSFFDPYQIIIYDEDGNAVAASPPETALEEATGGSDFLYNFIAPYSGVFYVDAGWHQGSFTKTVMLTVSEDLKMLPGFTGNDYLIGSSVFAGTGNDSVVGTAGADYLRGDEGDDVINGADGNDDINGNMGADTASGGAGDDWVVGGKDNDSLKGEQGDDVVLGNIGNDTCEGGAGNDVVRGGQDNDLVLGGSGNDFVSGDKGSDTMTGGDGADLFHTFGDAGIDRVTDFHLSEGDRVMLDPGTQFTVSQSGADTVINMTGGGQMILVGVSMSTLTGNWIFGA